MKMLASVRSRKAEEGADIMGERELEYLADLRRDCVARREAGTVSILLHIGPDGDVAPEITALHLAPRCKFPVRQP